VFTIVIMGSDRPKFGSPESQYVEKSLCATGQIQAYKGKAEIIARDPRQLRLKQ
jgi:hypothetical protein